MVALYKSPNPYDNNQECKLTFACSKSEHVIVEFLQFDVEHHSSCKMDFLAIGKDKKCGSANPTFSTTDREIKIHFRSNEKTTAYGFKLHLGCKSKYTIYTYLNPEHK